MRVYKFLNSEFALKDIREQRIKISEFHDLNDPFEFLPVDVSDPKNRAALLAMRDTLGKTRGILSFASTFTNPVLWAHTVTSIAALVWVSTRWKGSFASKSVM